MTLTKKWKAGVVATALAVSATSAAMVGPASANSTSVAGKFDTPKVVFGDDCPAASSKICALGTAKGKLKGSFSFGVSSLIQTVDTPTTNVVVFTGDATLDMGSGSLTCKSSGTVQTTGDGPLAGLCVVTSGTGEFEGATGHLQVTGTFTFGAGASGDYTGSIVRR